MASPEIITLTLGFKWAAPSVGINQLTGDGAAGPGSGSQVLTLATVNSGPGACGDATHVCEVTTNGKGLVTGQSAVSITPGGTARTCNSYGLLLHICPRWNYRCLGNNRHVRGSG